MESGFLLPDVEDDDAGAVLAGHGARRAARANAAPTAADGACRHARCARRAARVQHKWVPLSGRGTIWSFVVAHPPLLPAYQNVAPYNVITVALDEDPQLRLVGNLVARADGPINEVDPATIRIGEPVRVVFQQVEDVFLPRWMRV